MIAQWLNSILTITGTDYPLAILPWNQATVSSVAAPTPGRHRLLVHFQRYFPKRLLKAQRKRGDSNGDATRSGRVAASNRVPVTSPEPAPSLTA
jgi:hypothetical protein